MYEWNLTLTSTIRRKVVYCRGCCTKEIETAETEATQGWLVTAGLVLTYHKVGAVLIKVQNRLECIKLRVGKQIIRSKEIVKYIGVMFDNRIKF